MRRKLKIGLSVGLSMLVVGLLFLLPPRVIVIGSGEISLSNSVAMGSEAGELVELDWMRTRNSKVFHSYDIHRDYHDIYLDAVHYEVGHSREVWVTNETTETIYWTTWEDIDNTLIPAGELSPWDWQMAEAGYHIYALEDFNYGQILKLEKTDPYGIILGDVAFQPMALQWTNDLDQIQEVSMPQAGTLSVVDNRIEWDNAYGSNIDFSWTCYSTRLMKLLAIDSLSDLPTPEQYIIDGGNPVLELNLIFDPSSEVDIYIDNVIWVPSKPTTGTFGTIEFKLDGTTLWGFMPLRVWDSSGVDEIAVVQQLEKAGNKLYISARIPSSWIQEAVYPIYIDAVVDEQVETSTDDANELVSDGSMDLTDTIIDLGSYTGGPTHAGFRFTGIDTTDVEDVRAAYLEFYPASSDVGAVSYTWYGEDIASAPTFTSADYDISNRTGTTASVTENPPNSWTKGTWVQTADLSSILNEVFSRGDWISGNDLAILNIYNSGSGERRLRSWDYNDHSKAPKLHFENPTEVTYYFDAYTASEWTDSTNMVDGSLTTYASTSSDGNQVILSSSTCDGTDLGAITKVEIRCYGYGDGNDRIDFSFDVSRDPEYQATMPASEDWCTYLDVTGDPHANGWTWAKIADGPPYLRTEYDKVQSGNDMFCAKVEIRVTYTPSDGVDISNIPTSKGFGTVDINTDYWSNDSAPTWPLDDSECYFTVTNNSGAAVDITVKGSNFTGGVGWTLAGTPGENTVTMKAGKSGDALEDNMVTLTTSEQGFITALADTGTKKWEIKFESATSHTDGDLKTGTVTLTATLS